MSWTEPLGLRSLASLGVVQRSGSGAERGSSRWINQSGLSGLP